MEDNLRDTREHVHEVDEVPEVCEVSLESNSKDLANIVCDRVDGTDQEQGRVKVFVAKGLKKQGVFFAMIYFFTHMFWKPFDLVFKVDEIVVNDKNRHVEEVGGTTDHMPSSCEFLPLEFNDLQNCIRIVDI